MSELLKKVLREQAHWEKLNFGNQPTWHPVLGVWEESGELAHAILKISQGIRGSREELLDKAGDAIGDMFIFLCGFANRKRVGDELCCVYQHPHQSFVSKTDVAVILELCTAVGKLTQLAGKVRPWWMPSLLVTRKRRLIVRAIVLLLGELSHRLIGKKLEVIVSRVWDEVKARNWKRHNSTGKEDGGRALSLKLEKLAQSAEPRHREALLEVASRLEQA